MHESTYSIQFESNLVLNILLRRLLCDPIRSYTKDHDDTMKLRFIMGSELFGLHGFVGSWDSKT